MNRNMLSEVVGNIVEQADELKSKENRCKEDFAALCAYAECLCILQEACSEAERKAIGLDFDIDAKYLC